MSYRKKAPAAKTLSVAQQLNKVRSAVAGPLPFQVHNAIALLEQMRQAQKPLFDKFSKEAHEQKFFPARVVTEGLRAEPHLYTLPLPLHFISEDDSADDFEPRSFYHASAIENPDKLTRAAANVYAPRCGLSGLFFTREEVVDNLQAAVADLALKSPFWIHSGHPGLESGFLNVRDGSEAICISLTANVMALADVAAVKKSLLHPSLRGMVTDEKTGACSATKAIPLGMNALNGQICENPFVQNFPNRGLWISQDQLLMNNLSAKKSTGRAKELFTLVEVEQWKLFNADQLVVPGRLGLRRALNIGETGRIFQPV